MLKNETTKWYWYTGSTKDMDRRLTQYQNGEGANHTKKRLPVILLYYEKYDRIDTAFYREKQVQGWSRAKKEALMRGELEGLHDLAECKNNTHYLVFRTPDFGLGLS
ncbi:GIY-YIG nuclease family protein [Aquimarina algiphila]|uniref:GIY-YIG nuclease family protein n=1 Tax=Aquimarina algiphila TaxID=2047982 RepID=UPI00232D74E1|nr:GIY-YIG nuclease family protein [Aquimarina algiphila]